jgi:anti-anti-sigma regulatory factor
VSASEAVDRRTSDPAIPGASKLAIEKFADGPISCLKFVGTIDESFEGKKLGSSTGGTVLIVDLGAVKKISSFGIREWVDFISTASHQVQSVVLIECAPKVVDQLNMVANFAGSGRVFSFYTPFRCDYCDSAHRVLLQVDRDFEALKTMKLADRACPSCKESMYFDEDGATFFSYLLGQGTFALEPEVAAFLASKLNYAVADLNRKLRVDKLIDGTTTYLRLVGDLDDTFPRDKLADGLRCAIRFQARQEPEGGLPPVAFPRCRSVSACSRSTPTPTTRPRRARRPCTATTRPGCARCWSAAPAGRRATS